MSRPTEDFDLDAMRYADGEMSPEERIAFEARLSAEPELAAEVAGIEAQSHALSELFAFEAERMVPTPEVAVLRPKRWVRFAAPALAMAASFVIGIFVSDVIRPPAPSAPLSGPPSPMDSWKVSAAAYQRLYTQETLDLLPTDKARLNDAVAQAGGAVGIDLQAVTAPEGLDLEQAQLLEFNGIPLVQLSYRSDAGDLMALCIFPRKTPGAATQPGPPGTILDQTAVEWTGEDFAFLLIGNANGATLEGFADRFATALN